MSRFWVKIDEGVEGPFEAAHLKFVQGFGADTLISPESEIDNEVWVRAAEAQELGTFFVGRKVPAQKASEPVAETPAAPESAATLPVTEVQLEPPVPPEKIEAITPVVSPEEILEASLVTEEKIAPAATVAAEKNLISDTDILEVMEKISQQLSQGEEIAERLDQAEAAQTQAEARAHETAAVELIPRDSPVPLQAGRARRNLKRSLVSVGLLLIVSTGIWTLTQTDWKNRMTNLFSKKDTAAKQTQPDPVQEAVPPDHLQPVPAAAKVDDKTETAPAQESAGQPLSETKKIVKKTPVRVVTQAKATVPPKPALQDEKYILPGVPAPKVAATDVPPEQSQKTNEPATTEKTELKTSATPAPALKENQGQNDSLVAATSGESSASKTEPEPQPKTEPAKKESPKKEVENQFYEAEWMTQTGLGQ